MLYRIFQFVSRCLTFSFSCCNYSLWYFSQSSLKWHCDTTFSLDEELLRTNPRLILWCLPLQSPSTPLFCSFLSSLIKTTKLAHLFESSSERYSLPRHIRAICCSMAAGVPSACCRALFSDVRCRHRCSVVATVSWEHQANSNLQQ